MSVRTSSAEWKGTLKEGAGTMKVGSGAYEGPYTHASRFATGPGTNPEELIGAAHAGCYSMFLSALLTKAGFTPTRIVTTATVHLTDGPTISPIEGLYFASMSQVYPWDRGTNFAVEIGRRAAKLMLEG